MLDTWVEENTGKHYCQCFCGETIKIKRIYYHAGIPKFKNTHYRAKGKDSPTWKGGITEYRGYVFIKKPEHLRAGQNGYVKRAVLVWEENTKTSINKGQILHHKNGIKNDDRFENLELTDRAKHAAIHATKNIPHICHIHGCHNKYYARGFCHKHWVLKFRIKGDDLCQHHLKVGL